ncbi:Ferrous-iron efflux pump FieF [subsurface metagenome]
MVIEKSERASLFSVLVNISLFLIKYFLGIFSGSLALIADSIHSISDVIGSMTLFIGLKIAKRKSKVFPYGLYKVENLIALVCSLLIFFAGYKIALSAITGEGMPLLRNIPLTLPGICLILSIIYVFMRYERKIARLTQSPSLAADAEEYRTDLYTTIVILGSFMGSFLNIHLDRIASLIISAFIFKAGGVLFLNAIKVLLDASLDFATLDQVKTVILGEPRVDELKSLTGRNSGRYKFIEAEITIKARELEKAHRVSKALEAKIKKSIPYVDHILIHYEPVKKAFINVAIPYIIKEKKVSEHFGEAPAFLVLKVKADSDFLVKQDILINPFLLEERGKGIMAAEFLVKNGVDVVVLKRKFHGKGAQYVFRDAGVEIKTTEKSTIREVMDELNMELGKEQEKNSSF